jgi:hypothetical protein
MEEPYHQPLQGANMSASFDEMIAFFRQVAASDVSHTGGTYLAHAAAVHRDLKKWGFDDDVAKRRTFSLHLRHGIVPKFQAAARAP